MSNSFLSSFIFVHRHIGGLEKLRTSGLSHKSVHRHIGGLEILSIELKMPEIVHRHIGGLETIESVLS